MKKENVSDAQIIRRLKVNESAFFPAYRRNTIRQRVYETQQKLSNERHYVTETKSDEGVFKVTRTK